MANTAGARIAALVVAGLAAAAFGAPAIAISLPELPAVAVVAPARQSHAPKPTLNPTPVPTPTAVPTPIATPTPTLRPTAPPGPTAVPPTSAPTPKPTTGPTAKPTTAPTPRTTKGPQPATPRPSQQVVQHPSSATAKPTGTPAAAAAGVVAAPTGSVDLSPDLGSGGLGLGVLAIGLVGAGIVFFALFGRRRRGEPSVGDLAVAGASELPSGRASTPPMALDGEENVPRWLRASVRDARFWTPSREPRVHTSRRHALTFAEPLAESANRLVVRYDNVDVLDQPNEAYAHLVGEVGTGDEVEIVELNDAWALVRTPRGVTGWLPTMTIGALEAGATQAAPEPAEAPAAPDEVVRPPARQTPRRRRSASTRREPAG